MKVVLIGGKAESGKGYVCDMLNKKLCGSVKQIAFGDYLKFILLKYFGWNGKKDVAGRNILQLYGNTICRGWDEDFFANIVVNFIDIFQSRWDFVLVTDWRYPNEYLRMAEKFDTTTVIVKRAHKSILTDEQLKNESETSLDDFTPDFTIENNEGLESQVDALVAILQHGKTGRLDYV